MAAPSGMDALKRRQARQVTLFLVLVAAATAGAFHLFRQDLIAFRRGESELAAGDFTAAMTDLKSARQRGYRSRKLDQALGEVTDRLAGQYQGEGRPDLARSLYLDLGPVDRLPRYALGRLGDIEEQAGKFADAADVFGRALQAGPWDAALALRRGRALLAAGRRDEAAEAFRALLARDPGSKTAELLLARTLFWAGRYAEAVNFYRQALPP